MTTVAEQTWRGLVNQVRYALAYVRQPDEATAQVFAQRMIERRVFPSGPQAYLDGLAQAAQAPQLIEAPTPGGPDEATLRAFCGQIVAHLRHARATTYADGWPPERFTQLPARDWPWASAPVTAVVAAGLHEVSARTWRIFEFSHSPEGTTAVLVLRLRTGEVVALVVPPGPSLADRRRTMLKVLDGDPATAVASFAELTGFPADSIVPPDAVTPNPPRPAAPLRGELEAFRLFIAQGRLFRVDTGTPFDTRLGTTLRPGPERAIYVMDSQANVYASLVETIGEFHHSSLLAGRPAAGAGEMVVHDGRLVEISGRSATYPMSHASLDVVLSALAADGLVTSDVVVHRG